MSKSPNQQQTFKLTDSYKFLYPQSNWIMKYDNLYYTVNRKVFQSIQIN